MDARSAVRASAAILIIVAGGCGIVFANSVHIYRSDFNLLIPAPHEPDSRYGRGQMDDAIIEVPDYYIIHDLDIRLTLTHESLFDLQIILQSPAGTNVALNLAGNLAFIVRGRDGRLTAVGHSGELFFDDEADVFIEEAVEPFVGPFRPAWALSLFDGQDAFGLWRLRIHDAFYADTGVLNSFELIITTTTPEPNAAVFLTLGAGLITLFKPRRNRKNI